MSACLILFRGELNCGYALMRRYWLDTVAGMINLLLFLVFIQLGIYSFQPEMSNKLLVISLEKLTIGFFVFSIIGAGISSITSNVSESAMTGVLEQLILSPIGSGWVFFCRALVHLILSSGIYLATIPICMTICRHWFRVDFCKLLFFSIPLWIASCAVGFALGALTLIYKKTQSFTNLIQFLILGLMVLPSYPFNALSWLPISPQAAVLNKVLVEKQVISWNWVLFLYLQSAFYLATGLAVFKEAENYAKQKGILGQY